MANSFNYFRPFVFLHDYDVAVTTACSVADVAAALVVLLVVTPPHAALTAVDP